METPLDILGIMRRLPHRYPFLLIDRILKIGPEEIVALKNVTMNEPFFPGHFPGHPVMPGVLIVEALAQAVADICLEHPAVREARVRVEKPGALRFARSVGVEITRGR